MMIRSVIVVMVTLIAGTCLADQALTIADREFEFGKVPQNSTVRHQFWMHSTGSDTLRIEKVVTGCTCTIMPLEKDWLAPGDSMPAVVWWDIERRVGKIGRYPKIHYDSDLSPTRMSLTGTAMQHPDSARPIRVSPYKFELSRTQTIDLDSLEFRVDNTSSEDMILQILSYPVEECDYYVPDTIPAGQSARGFIRVKPEYSESEFKSSITIQAVGDDDSRLSIPIRRRFF
ncbi:MAG: DUF1573 domain-containing protein [bacterium]